MDLGSGVRFCWALQRFGKAVLGGFYDAVGLVLGYFEFTVLEVKAFRLSVG